MATKRTKAAAQPVSMTDEVRTLFGEARLTRAAFLAGLAGERLAYFQRQAAGFLTRYAGEVAWVEAKIELQRSLNVLATIREEALAIVTLVESEAA